MTELKFLKSSRCTSGSCVEVAFTRSTFCASGACVDVRISREHDYVLVRDSRGDTVTYNHDEWRAFVAGVKAGEFDV